MRAPREMAEFQIQTLAETVKADRGEVIVC